MKYYKEMREIEDQIIRLDTVESMLRILGESETNHGDVANVIWHLTDIVEDTNEKLSHSFHELWNQIRDDTRLDDVEKDLLITREYVNPSKSSSELNDIVNNWVRSEGC